MTKLKMVFITAIISRGMGVIDARANRKGKKLMT